MKVKHALLLLVTTAGALLIMTQYLRAVQSTVAQEKVQSCALLEGQPLQLPAPDFELPALEGPPQRLSASRGKVVLLNFWATWCPPCVEEIPSLARLPTIFAGKPFALITASVDEKKEDVLALLKKSALRRDALPVLMDTSKSVSESYGTVKFPETFLIDPAGVIRYKFIYKRDWSSPSALACLESLLPRP
jgi:thiol-disulfide isomerase/thioredoxin